MNVGVISDSHDNLPNLRYALRALGKRGVEVVFHCGDLISPFVTRELGQFPGAVHVVFGNNDGDRFLTLKLGSAAATNVTHYGEFGFVTVEGHKIGFTHYYEYAKGFAAAGLCDAAFFGHTHVHHKEMVGDVLVLNPGELLGLMGKPSYCVYNTGTRTFTHTVFDPQPWPG